jgi:hypothetical protein
MRKDSAQILMQAYTADATHTSQAQAGSQSGEMRQELSGISADTYDRIKKARPIPAALHFSFFSLGAVVR